MLRFVNAIITPKAIFKNKYTLYIHEDTLNEEQSKWAYY